MIFTSEYDVESARLTLKACVADLNIVLSESEQGDHDRVNAVFERMRPHIVTVASSVMEGLEALNGFDRLVLSPFRNAGVIAALVNRLVAPTTISHATTASQQSTGKGELAQPKPRKGDQQPIFDALRHNPAIRLHHQG